MIAKQAAMASASHWLVRRLTSVAAAPAIATVLLAAGFVGPATAANEYSFWQSDGCRYTWAGAAKGWQQGLCGPTNQVGWGRGAATGQWYHWVGNGWRFQGIRSDGTMDTPNGIFIVPFTSDAEEHIFVYDYAGEQWYHIGIVKQSVQGVPNPPQLETTSGWRSLDEIGSPVLDTMVREWQSLQDDIILFIPV